MLCRVVRFECNAPSCFAARNAPVHALARPKASESCATSGIGRSWLATVSIGDEFLHVAKHHATLVHNTATHAYTLIPLHDTFVNESKLEAPASLAEGDIVSLGGPSILPDGEPNWCTFRWTVARYV